MSIKELTKTLGLSFWKLAWAYVSDGGIWGIVNLLRKRFSELLQNVSPDKRTACAEITKKLATCIRHDVQVLATRDDIEAAGVATADSLENLAAHLEDGDYTEMELKEDADAVGACVSLWKAVVNGKNEGMG